MISQLLCNLLCLGLFSSCVPQQNESPETVASKNAWKVSNDLKVVREFEGEVRGITFYNQPFVYSWEFAENDGRKVDSWVGCDGDEPAYVVKSVSLTLNGVFIHIPYEAFMDFGDPNIGNKPYVMASKEQFSMFFSLSDGGGSARVRLDFKDGRYVGRTIDLH